MIIIGKDSRLEGLNMRVYRSDSSDSNAENRIGGVFEIVRSEAQDGYLYFEPHSCFSIYEVKIVLDDNFLEKFKSEKIAVNCRTEKEATKFLSLISASDRDFLSHLNYTKGSVCYRLFNPLVLDSEGFGFSRVSYFESNGYTIIKFSDCVIQEELEKDFIDTEDFQEFVKYWKENKVAVRFTSDDEKLKFYKMLGCSDKDFVMPCRLFPLTYWDTERLSANSTKEEHYLKSTYKIIESKDLKNWREILNVKGEKVMKEKKYELTKERVTFKELLSKDPCRSELDKFCTELIQNDYDYKDIINGNIYFTNKTLFEYRTVQYNIDWFIENGFVQEVNDFEPIKFRICIKTDEQLLSLLKHLFLSEQTLNKESKGGFRKGYDDDFICDIYQRLEDLAEDRGLI